MLGGVVLLTSDIDDVAVVFIDTVDVAPEVAGEVVAVLDVATGLGMLSTVELDDDATITGAEGGSVGVEEDCFV